MNVADADRGIRPPGRGFPLSQGRGRASSTICKRDGHAARGGAAQPRGAWPHPQDRCVGGARHAGRACGHDRGGDRSSVPVIPLRLANLPEFKNYLQPVIASDKVRYVGEPVAVVVAETQGLAEDALEAIALDIERLPALPDRHAAAADDRSCSTGRQQSRGALHGDVRRCRRGVREGGLHPQGELSLPPADRTAAGDARPDRRMGCGGSG